MTQPPTEVPDLVLRGRVVLPGHEVVDGIVASRGERIVWVGSAVDAPSAGWPAALTIGTTLLPGLIDVHCHGGAGHAFPDGELDGSRTAALHHLAHGTTGVVVSLVTAEEAAMTAAVLAAAALADENAVLGIHLEGPFLAPVRCGAQDPTAMRAPDLRLLDRLLDAGRGHVVSMTYAPELDGAAAVAKRLAGQGVMPSVGHTDADFGTASAAFRAGSAVARTGLVSVTHLFNGMRPFHHRDPGVIGACLAAAARGDAVVELVADGVHLADATVAMVLALVGPAAVALVTDAMPAAGLGDGRYHLGSRAVRVTGGVARLDTADTTRSFGALAGGTMRLLDVVRRCVQHGGVGLATAVEAASRTPARLLGLEHDRGSLMVGLRADVVAVDDDLAPLAVWSGGRRVTGADGPH